MKLPFFKKTTSIDQNTELDKQRIEEAIDGFKEIPAPWNEQTMGSMSEVRQAILDRLNESIEKKQSLKIGYRRIIATAACIALVSASVWLGLQYKDSLLDEFFPANTIIVHTERNEIKKVSFEDGSVVWLNGNSSLSYPDRFHHLKREVLLLEGEAYFDIHHDNKKPFQVKAGKTLTNVLGTSFNISSYKWLKNISVTVMTGKVAVNNQILLPDDQILYNRLSNRLEKKKLKSNYVSSWREGKVTFNDQDFKTVAAILENKFNVTISFSDKAMENNHFTATFEPHDQLTDILGDLTITRGYTYQIKNSKITINH